MISKKKVLALIPARGGSKGIKGKNIYPLCGIPLISYTVRAAKKSKYIDEIVVSTDDREISAAAESEGAAVLKRPESLATDTARTIDVVLHAVGEYDDYPIIVLLQPTSPLRTADDIDNALDLYISSGETPLCSLSPVNDNPVLIRTIDSSNMVSRLIDADSTVRRQDMKEYYRVNGAIYINPADSLNADTSLNDNPLGYVMTREHSVDIDEMCDILYAQAIISVGKEKKDGK